MTVIVRGCRMEQKPPKPPSKALLMAIGIAITLGFSGISGSIFKEMRDREYAHAYRTASNLVATIAAEVEHHIEIYNLSLEQTVSALKDPEVLRLDSALRNRVLLERYQAAAGFGSMQVVNSSGRIVMDSANLSPSDADLSKRPAFRVHQENANVGLFISEPYVADNGEFSISFSRRIGNADGSFRGIVLGTMGLGYFHDLFRKVQLGTEDSLALISADSTVLMRYPFDIGLIGRSIRRSKLFDELKHSPVGSYQAEGKLDKVERLFLYKQVGTLPLVVVEGVSIEALFSSWWNDVWLLGALLCVLSILTLGLIFTLAKALERRYAAEHRLANLAATDGLTGLSNRRRFDEALNQEWNRALRQNSALALIMIDVDHFKSFNDLFGHLAGDQALVNVANCIAGSAQRSADLCARYGGEEFAVLLPGVDVHGAIQVAENIRARLLELRQKVGPKEVPTISLGVASLTPAAGLRADDLIKSADLALYDAKRDGRNRTARCTVLPFPDKARVAAVVG